MAENFTRKWKNRCEGVCERWGKEMESELLLEMNKVWEHERTLEERICVAALAHDSFLRRYIAKRFLLVKHTETGVVPVVEFNRLGLVERLRLAWRLVWQGTEFVG